MDLASHEFPAHEISLLYTMFDEGDKSVKISQNLGSIIGLLNRPGRFAESRSFESVRTYALSGLLDRIYYKNGNFYFCTDQVEFSWECLKNVKIGYCSVDFSAMTFANVELHFGIDLVDTRELYFDHCDLSGSQFSGEMKECSFEGCDLQSVYFEYVDFDCVQFVDCDCRYASLHCCDLDGVCFVGSDLRGVQLNTGDFAYGVDGTSAEIVTFRDVLIDRWTVLPDGMTVGRNGAEDVQRRWPGIVVEDCD